MLALMAHYMLLIITGRSSNILSGCRKKQLKQEDYTNGRDMGRIYRITPTETKAAEWIKGLKLGDATPAELVEHLKSNNYWWRINAQRLLVDRNDKTVVPALIQLTKNNYPEARLHALWTLEGLDELKPEIIIGALKDSSRRHKRKCNQTG